MLQKKWQLIFIFCAFILIPFISHAQMLDSLSTAMIDSCLNYLHLTKEELGFEKAWAVDDTFKLKIVDHLLKNPLELSEYVEGTVQAADENSNDPVGMLKYISVQIDSEVEEKKIDKLLKKNKLDPQHPFKYLLHAIRKAEPYRREFYSNLDSLELHDLLMNAPNMWGEDEDTLNVELKGSLQYEFGAFVDTSRTVDEDRILDIIKKLNRTSLTKAGLIFLDAVWKLKRGIDNISFEPMKENIPGVEGNVLYYRQTEFGEMVIGGEGSNTYSKDFAVIIDVGGNDVYRCRAGGAVGELGNPYSLVLDLSGNDIYLSGEKAIDQGAGFLGIGTLIDCRGDDIYQGFNYSQGVGFFGIGLLYDNDGYDDYRAGFFSEGSGHIGTGLLIDNGNGDDRYFAKLWAQGMGGTFGFGMLRDAGGDDSYRTGGAYLHAPLLPEDYKSFSHGFGMGWRPRAGGGIGVLYDLDGNDFYDGEVFCEGSSYWYSLGILIDGGGNDSYNAAQYAQGAGIHLSLGALWDRGGDDQYHSRNGVVGGTAHDLSVGMLIDDEGDDNYIVSGGYGVSLTNSFALFIDKLGADMYSTWEKFSLGSVRWSRDFAGCGIFLDLEGRDVYPRNTLADNGNIWIQQNWGIGIDLDRDVVSGGEEDEIEEIILTAKDSLRTAEELYKEASLWEVGSNKEKVARAKKAFFAKGMEAVNYVCINKLGTSSSLELRLIENIAETYPDSIAPLLLEKIKDKNRFVQKNAVWLLGKTKYMKAVEPFLKMLKKKKYKKLRISIISALGNIEDKRATISITEYINDERELCRINVVKALKKLKDERAVPTLIQALDDPMFTVRSASMSALKKYSDTRSALALLDYIKSKNSLYPELGVCTLADMIKSFPDSTEYEEIDLISYELFEELVNCRNDLVRAESVEALYRMGDDACRKWLDIKMESECSPVVKAAYDRIRKEIMK